MLANIDVIRYLSSNPSLELGELSRPVAEDDAKNTELSCDERNHSLVQSTDKKLAYYTVQQRVKSYNTGCWWRLSRGNYATLAEHKDDSVTFCSTNPRLRRSIDYNNMNLWTGQRGTKLDFSKYT